MIRSGRRNSAEGYTLVEMLVVLVIVGFIAMIAGPRIGRGFQGAELKTSVRQFAAILRAARNTAITQRAIIGGVVELNGPHYAFRLIRSQSEYADLGRIPEQGSSDQALNINHALPEILTESYSLPTDIIFSDFQSVGGQASQQDLGLIEFFPKGNSTGGIFIISNQSGAGYAVMIDRVTGRITIESVS